LGCKNLFGPLYTRGFLALVVVVVVVVVVRATTVRAVVPEIFFNAIMLIKRFMFSSYPYRRTAIAPWK